MPPAAHLIPLAACLVAGTVWDLTRRRVPNVVSGALVVSGVVSQVVEKGGVAAVSGVAAGILTVALLYKFWMAGGIGGGDVKFAAGVAVWVGLGHMIRFGLAAAAAGGVVALAAFFLSARAVREEIKANLALAAIQRELPPVPDQARGRISVPYAIAIAAGAAFTFLTT
jgi:prepilin peptidase CpaA